MSTESGPKSGGLVLAAALLAILFLVFGETAHKPTADQLYGCTVEAQAPNGECK